MEKQKGERQKLKKRIAINEKQRKGYYRIVSKSEKWRTGIIKLFAFLLRNDIRITSL